MSAAAVTVIMSAMIMAAAVIMRFFCVLMIMSAAAVIMFLFSVVMVVAAAAVVMFLFVVMRDGGLSRFLRLVLK